MNIFVIVEGRAEAKVYKRWIPYVNPQITYVGRSVSDLTTDSFAIISSLPDTFSLKPTAALD
jgi:hypothetical protein